MADGDSMAVGLAGPVPVAGWNDPGAMGVLTFDLARPAAVPVPAPVAAVAPFELTRPADLTVGLPAVAGFGALRLVREGSGPSWFDRPPARTPGDTVRLVFPYVVGLDCEVFGLLLLDAQHRAIGGGPVEITRGLVSSTLVHPREVFRAAIVAGATAIVCWHNHPSGDPTPSADDRHVTDQLVAAGRTVGIPVEDHVIVGGARYVSFREAGLM